MRILDFGAGRGAMALALREKGADVVAVEPSGSDHLTKLGLAAYSDMDKLPSNLSFDGIVCVEVLEHLLSPNDALAKLYERLKPGAWIFVTTPNAAGLPAMLAGGNWREAKKPGHILFITPVALGTLLQKTRIRDSRRLRWLVRYPGVSGARIGSSHFAAAPIGWRLTISGI